MAEAMNELITRNNMSVTELVIKENALVDQFTYKDKTTGKNKIFFTCGSIRSGYFSPAIRKDIEDGVPFDKIMENAQYAEVSNDGGKTFVPTIMKGANRVASFGANLLRSK